MFTHTLKYHSLCGKVTATLPLMLITDFVPINLRDHLRKSREPVVYQVMIGSPEMLDYIVQIANAMAYLEGCGIVHNNLCT